MAVATQTMTTTESLKELAEREPRLNLTEAAIRVGVSRQRVHQIANKHNLPFFRGHHPKPRGPCDICGRTVRRPGQRFHGACVRARAWPELTCPVCGRRFRRRRANLRQNGRSPRYKRIFARCSHDCRLGPYVADCCVCGDSVKLDIQQSYHIRNGMQGGALCGKGRCKAAWIRQRTKKMREARAARRLALSEGV